MDLLDELRNNEQLWFSKIPKDILVIIKPFLYKYEYYSSTDKISKKYSYYMENGMIVHHGCLISYRYQYGTYENMERICNYIHGKKHGLETYYNRDGQTIFQTINWNQGVMDG